MNTPVQKISASAIPDQAIPDSAWFSSRFCNNSACVQVAHLPGGLVALRDSKDTAKDAHVFDREEWGAFLAGVKNGQFDLP